MDKSYVKLLICAFLINILIVPNTMSMNIFDFVNDFRDQVQNTYDACAKIVDGNPFTYNIARSFRVAVGTLVDNIGDYLDERARLNALYATQKAQEALRKAQELADLERREEQRLAEEKAQRYASEALAEQERQRLDAIRTQRNSMIGSDSDLDVANLRAFEQLLKNPNDPHLKSVFYNSALALQQHNAAMFADQKRMERDAELKKAQLELEAANKSKLQQEQSAAEMQKMSQEHAHARQVKEHEEKMEKSKVKAALEMRKQTMQLLQNIGKSFKENPHLYIGSVVAIISAIYVSKEASSLAARRLDGFLSQPQIIKETNQLSLLQKVAALVMSSSVKQLSLAKDIVLKPKVETFMKDYAKRISGAIDNDLFLRGLILHGRPGTGKTLLACILSRMLGIPYFIISAASLFQLPTEKALQEVTKLFENAKRNKCIIFFDEAELIFPNRKNAKGISDDAKKLLNHILSYTGTESTDFVLILATNLLSQFDDAFLSRCDILGIDAPTIDERESIIKLYVKKYLQSRICNRKASPLQNLLGITPQSIKLNIDANALDQAQLEKMANETEGFVGRDLSDLILEIQRAAACTKGKRVTKEIVDSILSDKVEQAKAKLIIMQQHDKTEHLATAAAA